MDPFVGIPVSIYAAAPPWYERLFGGAPRSCRMTPRRSGRWPGTGTSTSCKTPDGRGNALVLPFVDDLKDRVAAIARQGIEPARRETYDGGVTKVTYRDADGSEVSFGGRGLTLLEDNARRTPHPGR